MRHVVLLTCAHESTTAACTARLELQCASWCVGSATVPMGWDVGCSRETQFHLAEHHHVTHQAIQLMNSSAVEPPQLAWEQLWCDTIECPAVTSTLEQALSERIFWYEPCVCFCLAARSHDCLFCSWCNVRWPCILCLNLGVSRAAVETGVPIPCHLLSLHCDLLNCA